MSESKILSFDQARPVFEQLRRDGKRIVHFGLTGDDSPFGFPLMIPQNETERVLGEIGRAHV